MSDALIRAAFETRIAAWAAAQTPAIPVAYENVPFTPPTGRYVRCWLLPASTQNSAYDSTYRKRQGVYQVDLCLPIGAGPGAADALAASLDTAFSTMGPMTQGSIKVYLLTPMSKAPAMQEPDRYVVPVSCAYACHTV